MTGGLFSVEHGSSSDSKGASAEFKLSITRALADQLADSLSKLSHAPLIEENLEALQPRPGVYELFVPDGSGPYRRVYVGKASKDLPARLSNHLRKLSGRSNISLSDVRFQCLYVDEDLEAAAPEKMLIKRYRGEASVPWNTNGFGNKDPGRNRDRSLVKVNHFDAEYPINLDLPIEFARPGRGPLQRYVEAVKANLPFNFRFDKSAGARKVYAAIDVELPKRGTARELIRHALGELPDGWQVTVLPGYVILYQEEEMYDSARLVWRKQGGAVRQFEGPNRRGDAGDVDESESDEG